MSPEAIHPKAERNAFLRAFFADEFANPNPGWQEFETATAHWRIVAVEEERTLVVAVRTSEIGTIDSYSLDLDNPDEDTHVTVDGQAPLDSAIRDVEAQIELGLATPNSDELAELDELIDTLRLLDSIS